MDRLWIVTQACLSGKGKQKYPVSEKQIGLIILLMREDLQESLLLRRPLKSRKSTRGLMDPQESRLTRQRYVAPNEVVPVVSVPSITLQALEWQESNQQSILVEQPLRMVPRQSLKMNYWNDAGVQIKEKTLNDKVFNLNKAVQKKLYWFNMVMNTLMRLCLVNLLVFLAIEQKRIYLYLFLSLQITAMLLYLIIMIKMLFTRSDKESVYFQKIFNETDWADIEAERVMRSHFGLMKILSKIKIFFNPCTKFEKDTKISFLRQEIFKRIELVLVVFPFTVLFLLNKNDFVTQNYPHFPAWISGGIALEVFRTVVTYLTIFVYS